MYKLKLVSLILIQFYCTICSLQAQSSDNTYFGIPFQSIIRNTSGDPVINSNIDLRFSLISNTGEDLYKEIHSVQSDEFGRITAMIGKGNPMFGNFQTIDWSQWPISHKLEVYFENQWVYFGLTPLNAVPLSLYSLSVAPNNGFIAGDGLSIQNNIISIEDKPWDVIPRSAIRTQIITLTISANNDFTFNTTGVDNCPQVNPTVSISNGIHVINAIGYNIINNDKIEAVFLIPETIPAGLYDIVLAAASNCTVSLIGGFKIH
jgi:hypothetical protein